MIFMLDNVRRLVKISVCVCVCGGGGGGGACIGGSFMSEKCMFITLPSNVKI